jgi:hypothetical protein
VKKRRITDEQARLLAISFINRVVSTELGDVLKKPVAPYEGWKQDHLRDTLPEKWNDGQTSAESWDQIWQETRYQLAKIMLCLAEEGEAVEKSNPAFRFYGTEPG